MDKNPDLYINLPREFWNWCNPDCYDKDAKLILHRSKVPIENWVRFVNEAAEFQDVFSDTFDFQLKFGLLDNDSKPHFIKKDQLDVKISHLHEELAEIEKAAKEGDLAEFADGIIDLIYVAAGLGALCKLPMDTLWADVQYCNMNGKKRVENLEEATKRGSTFDVRKTDKWMPPRGKEIIEYYGNLCS